MTIDTPISERIGILWRRLDSPGHDAALLSPTRDGWSIEGVALFLHDASACCLCYSVQASERWHTREARVAGWVGQERVDVRILVTAEQQWFLNGVIEPSVTDCIDIDFAFTPATNTLPVRRLALDVGSGQAVSAAWLKFPEFVLERLDQSYIRRSEALYDYQAFGGSFRTELLLTPSGLVSSYPNLWQQESGI